MEKHFFNRFHLKNRLFEEGRLVFKDGGKTEGAAEVPADARPDAAGTPGGAAEAKPEDPAGAKPEGTTGEKPKGAAEAKPEGIEATPEAAATKREGAAERVRMRGQTEREQLKEELPQLPTKRKLEPDEFTKILDSGDEQHALDPIKISVKRKDYHINSDIWDHTNETGLRQIYLDCKRVLGNQKINTPFYATLFATLANAADPKKNRWLDETGDDYVSWFKEPIKYSEQLKNLQPDDKFFGGEQFVRAYQHLHYLKSEVLHSQDVAHVATLAKQEGLDSDPVATKVTDFVRDNVAKFTKAIHERDYATAGLYAVGIWALYKSIKELTGGNDKITKYLIYGAAAYAGYTFAKNAGYDILKIAGFKDKDFEVKDTPFEIMKNYIGEKPEYNDFDYSIPFRMSEVRLKDLHKMLEETNKKGDFFIHPKDFPAIFPDLANEWSFDMGLGEKGLGDTEGMSNKKLSAAQREYLRVGRQIYLTAMAMEEIYNQTLYKDHPDYKGIPYEEAIKDPVRNMGTVLDLLWAAQVYATGETETHFSEKSIEEPQEHVSAIFEGKNVDASVDEPMGQGHYSGYLKGFPVVFARDKDSYRVYLRNDYNGLKNPGPKYVRIPIEGPTRSGMADKAIEKVDKRMEELMAPLQNAGGRMLKKPEYKDGEWQTEVTLPGADEFGVKGDRPATGVLLPRNDGKGLIFTVKGTDVRINIDRGIERQYVAAIAILPKIIDQDKFRALRAFADGRRLEIEDPKRGDGELTLRIGKSKLSLTLVYDAAKDEFALKDPAQEKTLLGSAAFAKEYIEALSADDHFELTEICNKLEDTIKHSPEGFFKHLWQKLTLSTKDSPISGVNLDLFSSSVPDYFSNTVIDVTKYEALQKLRRAISTAKTLEDVERARKEILWQTQSDLEAVYDILSSENVDKGTWDRDEFIDRIVYPIRAASSVSSAYNFARNDFEYDVYGLINGLLQNSDLSGASHDKARDLLNVFAYYTAYLDNHTYKFEVDGSTEERNIDLDDLTFPPKAEYPGKIPIHLDPGLRGHLVVNYFEYVKAEILTRVRGKKVSVIPEGSNKTFWGIMEFEEWAEKKGSYTPLDQLDHLPPFKHGAHIDAANKPVNTELDKAIVAEFDRTVAYLMNEYPDSLSYPAIQAYLETKQKDTMGDLSKVGKLRIMEFPPGSGQYRSALWEWSDSIASLKTRGQQMKEIKKIVDRELVRHIFENTDDFFIKKPSISTRLKQKWPWLAGYI